MRRMRSGSVQVLPGVREEDGVMMGISLFIVGFVAGAVTIIVLAVLVAGD